MKSVYLCKSVAHLQNFVQRKQARVVIHCRKGTAVCNHLKNKDKQINKTQKNAGLILQHVHFILIIKLLLYHFLGQDRRGFHSCPPSLLQPCSSTPAWWCCETRRCRRSLRHSDYSNTPSSPLLRWGTQEWVWCPSQL